MYNKRGDKMKVYIEFIYIINFLLDFMILYGTKRLLKINKSNIRIIFGSLIGMLSTLLINISISNYLLLLIKLILSIIMIITSFGIKNIFKNLLYFYLISFILGGVIYLFDLETNYYVYFTILFLMTPFTIYFIVHELINYKININDKYLVTITYNDKVYKLEGFIDTGNKLTSPISKKSVILVNLKINSNKLIYIPYKALNTQGIIPCIKPDKVLINEYEVNNCLIGLAKDKFNIGNCNCILPNKIKERL